MATNEVISEKSVMDSDWICGACGYDENKPIVQCSICRKWFHMDCVGVNESSVKDKPWYCPQEKPPNRTIHSPPKHEEAKNTKQQLVNNELNSKSENMITAFNSTEKDAHNDKQSVHSHSSSVYQNKIKELEEIHAAKIEFITRKYELLLEEKSMKSDKSVKNIEIKTLINEKDLENHENINKWFNDCEPKKNVKITANPDMIELAKLTAEQIDVRKSTPHKLPIFSGNPKDWPMFINAYETSTQELNISNARNLLRLREHLKGEAFYLVEDNLQFPESVPEVIKTLKRLYGRPDVVINSMMEKIRNMPQPNLNDMKTFIMYTATVKSMIARMEACGMKDYLSNHVIFSEILYRLPKDIQLDWSRFKRRNNEDSNLAALSEFLEYLSEDVSEIITMNPQKSFNSPKNRFQKTSIEPRSKYVHVTNEITPSPTSVKDLKNNCVICGTTDHLLESCTKFLSLTPNQRWDVVVKNRLCRICLIQHMFKKCHRKIRCDINNCNKWHNKLLHKNKIESTSTADLATSELQPSTQSISEENVVNCNASNASNKSVLLRMIPVTIYNGNQHVNILAFLDDGSDTTLLDMDVANKLNLHGPQRDLCLNMMNESRMTENNSMLVETYISGPNGEKFKLKANTIKSLDLAPQSLSAEQLKNEFYYLKNIPIQSYELQKPKLLIGIDHFRFFVALDYREGGESDPIATKTRLGWIIGGPLNPNIQQSHIHHVKICDCNSDDIMFKLIQNHFQLNDVVTHQQPIKSKDDERAIQIMNDTAQKVGKKYEIGLLWKYDVIKLPNSLKMAENRLNCLMKRMMKDENFATNMRNTIQHYIKQNYIQKIDVTNEQSTGKCWYLPLFAVTNPNKPNKFRPVWDAAAKVDGVSLNSVLLKGPDMLCSLVSVLYKFRIGMIAVGADIQEMFHQINIRHEDRNYQRFLWQESNNHERETYVMNVMTFGAACSPTCAQFIKNKNAQCFEEKFPVAVDAIKNQHYVDDYLDSFNSEEEAITIINQVQYIHQQAGFNIRNWVSNSNTVIENMGNQAKSLPKDLNMDDDSYMEKILGLWWQPNSDSFTFKINYARIGQDYFNGKKRPTKRIVLKILMSVYDPLGLISCHLLNLKILLQDIWRSSIEWDQEISDHQFEIWKKWAISMSSLGELKIKRCYSSKFSNNLNKIIDLHVFCDAGERAYAAVAYIRIEDANGVDIALIGSKSKIAPMNPISIPRLELLSAELAARFAKNIIESHKIQFNRKFLWTDSTTVLKWLNGNPRNYRQFVMFRVGVILDTTTIKEWRWIPTNENPADFVTKNVKFPEIVSTKLINGPEFLIRNESEWSGKVWSDKEPSQEELKINVILNTINYETNLPIDINKYSKWERLVHTNAWVNRFCDNLRNKIKKSTENIVTSKVLLCHELIKSEEQLCKSAQWDVYKTEISLLRNNESISKTSVLKSYSPYLDNNGVMRVKGRISALNILDDYAKQPTILPKSHRVTELIVDYYHRLYLHLNHETVVNQIRLRYAVPKLRVVVRSVRSKCQLCKNMSAKPQPPEEGQLPTARLSPYCKPFTYTGVDFFGPMFVVNGRKQEKRYGVLFTCMTVRAVHIEIANSLSTDSFILAFRNFIARRGSPIEVRCDNGTNFHGSKNELEKTISQIIDEKFRQKFLTIKWVFNPPASAHMGGAWERLIQTVKRNLKMVLPTKTPTEEMLRSCLCEIEMIVNSRPLTYVPVEPNEPEALSPNHFLLGSSGGQKPLGEFNIDENPLALRRNWKMSQQIAEKFWKRWVNEYASTLTRRTKWFDKVKPIEMDDIVIVVDENLPRNDWPLGKIVEVRKGKDGQVRQAVIKTSSGILVRPAAKIAVLDVRKGYRT